MDRGDSSTTHWNVIARRVCAVISLLAICCLIYLTAFAAARQTADRAPVSLDEVKLKPGQYRWSLDEMSDEPIVIVVSLFSGIQLLSLGVMGEYVGRIYEEVKQRPRYIVSQSAGFGALDERSRQRGRNEAARHG